MTSAFVYPQGPRHRKHEPLGYLHAESYRPWLRDEFDYRCAYCLLREQWGLVRGAFALDHFLPVASHSEKRLDYGNLVYACASCNLAKSNRSLPDPETALIANDVHVNDDGTIAARSRAARRVIRILGLDSPEYTDFRALWIGIIELAGRYDSSLHRKLVGFPNDLPVLARLRPPGGNSRPEGVMESWYALKCAGRLPETY